LKNYLKIIFVIIFYEYLVRRYRRFVKAGDRVSQFDDICEVQSDKASVTITSRYDGLVKALHFNVDDVAIVGAALLDIEIEDDSVDDSEGKGGENTAIAGSRTTDSSDEERKRTEEAESRNDPPAKVLTTPAVRRIAVENDIRLEDVTATGKQGRVLKEDVLAHLRKVSAAPEDAKTTSPPQRSVTGRTIGLKGYSRHMWKTMTKSLVRRRR